MDKSDVFKEIIAFCEKNADPAIVKKYSRYFKEGYDAYGLAQDKIEEFRNERAGEWSAGLSADDVFALTGMLYATGKYEPPHFGVWLLGRYKNEWKKSHLGLILAWLEKDISNWAHCDVLCGEIVYQFVNTGVIDYTGLAPWRENQSRWARRAVPVSLFKTLTAENIPVMLEFIRPLCGDPERTVGQGVGWYLREAWKKLPVPVEEFLMSIKDTAARVVIQYATEKIPKESRERFRKAK
jgi:3-methyladenine DNA glycosylase AlkD